METRYITRLFRSDFFLLTSSEVELMETTAAKEPDVDIPASDFLGS